jgi:hypothetical protein
MRQKLSEQYKKEREEYCDKIISILELDESNCFLLCELDENVEKQTNLLNLKEDIKKCFTVSDISTFTPLKIINRRRRFSLQGQRYR